MISPDQAEQVTDSLLEPAKQELAEKQEKLRRRREARDSFQDAFFPAAVAAGIAIFFGDRFDSPLVAILVCAAVGAVVAPITRKGVW